MVRTPSSAESVITQAPSCDATFNGTQGLAQVAHPTHDVMSGLCTAARSVLRSASIQLNYGAVLLVIQPVVALRVYQQGCTICMQCLAWKKTPEKGFPDKQSNSVGGLGADSVALQWGQKGKVNKREGKGQHTGFEEKGKGGGTKQTEGKGNQGPSKVEAKGGQNGSKGKTKGKQRERESKGKAKGKQRESKGKAEGKGKQRDPKSPEQRYQLRQKTLHFSSP